MAGMIRPIAGDFSLIIFITFFVTFNIAKNNQITTIAILISTSKEIIDKKINSSSLANGMSPNKCASTEEINKPNNTNTPFKK